MAEEKRVCAARTKDGEQCRAIPGDSGYCVMHDPQHAETMALARTNAGTVARGIATVGEPPDELRSYDDLVKLLEFTMRNILQTPNSPTRSKLLLALAAQVANTVNSAELEGRLRVMEKFAAIRREAENAGGKRAKE
jgi:hypothetical protein